MKKLYSLGIALLFAFSALGQTSVFINEIHYDNDGSDVGEGVEIAGPAGTDLSTYTLTFYNGNNNAVYNTVALSGIIPDEGGVGYGAIWFAISGIQNGDPDGIALDNNGTLIQFLSYEGAFIAIGGAANGVSSTDIMVGEGGGTAVGESLQLTGTGFDYENFTWADAQASTINLINTGQTFATPVPTLTLVDAPTSGSSVEAGPEDLEPELEFDVKNFTIGEPGTGTQADGYIAWTLHNTTDNITHDSGVLYDLANQPVIVNVMDGDKDYVFTAELKDNTGMTLTNPEATYTLMVETFGYNVVANIAAFRAGVDGLYYHITGEVVVSYIVTENSRNQMYIQDASGGLLIDDPENWIETNVNIGDGIEDLKGELSSFNGVIQIEPTKDIDGVSSNGNTLVPQEISAADFASMGEAYESELIKITNVSFSDAGALFADNTNYNLVDGGTTIVCRVMFGDEDLVGQTIPSGTTYVIGLGTEINAQYHITPRYASDIEAIALSSEDIFGPNFKLFPNPTNLGYINVQSDNSATIKAEIFDILGKRVYSGEVVDNRLSFAKLRSGMYIIRLQKDNGTLSRKLIIY